MEKNYNTKMASLKATVADVRKLNAKQLDAENIKLQGQDIKEVWGFQDPEDFKKLCKRVNMDELENESYQLYNDEGELIYFNLGEHVTSLDLSCQTGIKRLVVEEEKNISGLYIEGCRNIEYLEIYIPEASIFCIFDHNGYEGAPYLMGSPNHSKLKTFKGDISGLSDIYFMCLGCVDLEEFSAKLPSELDTAMFAFLLCNLNSESVKHILNSLPENTESIHITMNESAVAEFNNITGNTEEIPLCDANYANDAWSSYELFSIQYKNCTIYPSINVYTSENINDFFNPSN